MDRQLLINNIIGAYKAAVAYGLPIIHSTAKVNAGLNNEAMVSPSSRVARQEGGRRENN